MRKIDKNLLLFCLLILCGSFACSPQYSAHFNNQPFYTENTVVVEEETIVPVAHTTETPEIIEQPAVVTAEAPETAVATTNKNMIARLAAIPSVKKIVEEHKENIEKLKERETNQKTLEKEIRKEEKRAQKEVKKQLIKEIKDVKGTEDKEAMNQKIFIGIVIAAAGIIIAILASSGLGAVAIIVGVGLIAWGIIEQGGV
jgi:uncharacterized membrane protein